MENTVAVDILLTTYNTNIEYLKLQLDSILNQTHKNFTLIISDDCSTKQEVKEVLQEYAKKDDRIKLYFQPQNLGYTKNFEFVLAQSTADYIAFSDHDDIWYLNKIEESLKALKEKNVDLVYCDANQIDEKGNILHESYLRYKNMPIINEKNNSKKEILAFSRHIAIGCSQIFTKEVKEKLIPFTPSTMAHDWNTVYIASKMKGIYCLDKPLFGYRLHGNNAFGGRSFKQNVHSVQVGADAAVTDNLRLGGFVGRSQANVDFNGDYGDGKVRSNSVGLYAAYLADNGIYVDNIVKYSRLHANSDHTEKRHYNAYTISSELGKRFSLANDWTITPQAQLAWTHISSQGNEDSLSSVYSRIGLRVAKGFALSNGWNLQPYAEVNAITSKNRSSKIHYTNSALDVASSRGRFESAVGLNAGFANHRFGLEVSRADGKNFDKPYAIQAVYRYQW